MKPTLLVLAAGMGSRYGGLKQMDPMGPAGETVLDYSVFDAIRAGFERVIFIIREEFASDFKEKITSKFADKIEVDFVFQDLHDLPDGFTAPANRIKPWGTSHAIWAARKVLNTPFAVINADDFYGADSFVQIANYFENAAQSDSKVDHYCMVGYNLENTLSAHGSVNRGICATTDGFLNDVEEHTEIAKEDDQQCRGLNLAGDKVDITATATASMNFWGFTPNLMNHLNEHFIAFLKERGGELKSECYIPTVVDSLIKAGKADCKILETSSSWFGVTYPEDKPLVVKSIQQLINDGVYPPHLWA